MPLTCFLLSPSSSNKEINISKRRLKTTRKQVKHVCIVIHVQRESVANKTESQRWQFSFQSGWKQVTIDVLEHPALSITECLDVTITDLLESKSLSFEDEALNQLLWCFTRIKYPSNIQPSLDSVLQLNQLLRSCSVILDCFKDLVVRWLKKRDTRNSHSTGLSRWQHAVACDRQALINYSHLLGAIQHYICPSYTSTTGKDRLLFGERISLASLPIVMGHFQ